MWVWTQSPGILRFAVASSNSLHRQVELPHLPCQNKKKGKKTRVKASQGLNLCSFQSDGRFKHHLSDDITLGCIRIKKKEEEERIKEEGWDGCKARWFGSPDDYVETEMKEWMKSKGASSSRLSTCWFLSKTFSPTEHLHLEKEKPHLSVGVARIYMDLLNH